jgi:hypothetical protein
MKTYLLTCFALLVNLTYSQELKKLNLISAKNFTQSQVDTMSQNYIIAQNYLAIESWDIFYKGDKTKSHVNINKDTIDIRPLLVAREKEESVFVNAYDIYTIEFFSLDRVKSDLKRKLTTQP